MRKRVLGPSKKRVLILATDWLFLTRRRKDENGFGFGVAHSQLGTSFASHLFFRIAGNKYGVWRTNWEQTKEGRWSKSLPRAGGAFAEEIYLFPSFLNHFSFFFLNSNLFFLVKIEYLNNWWIIPCKTYIFLLLNNMRIFY